MVWRFFHKKMPKNENLHIRGCQMPSRCSLYHKKTKTSNHLFFQCTFSTALWNWLQSIIHCTIDLSSILSTLEISDKGWCPQCRTVIISTIVGILNTISTCKNNEKFNKTPNIKASISLITANASLISNFTKLATNHSIFDFRILKAFKVACHPQKPLKIWRYFGTL